MWGWWRNRRSPHPAGPSPSSVPSLGGWPSLQASGEHLSLPSWPRWCRQTHTETQVQLCIQLRSQLWTSLTRLYCGFQSLRKILFGGTFHVFNYEWRKSFFQFRDPSSDFSYALETDRVRQYQRHRPGFPISPVYSCVSLTWSGAFQGGAGPIQTVVQARIIKHLLFVHQSSSERQTLHRWVSHTCESDHGGDKAATWS